MEISIRDGFMFYSVLREPFGCLIFEKERVRECIAYMNSTGFSNATIRNDYGFTINDIDFLNDINHQFHVGLVHLDGDNLSAIDGNPNIVSLTLSSEINEFPLGNLPNLEEAYIEWNSSLFAKGIPRKLSKLYLSRIRSPVTNLKAFPLSENLRELALIDSRSITSIAGIEGYPNLEHIEFSYLPRLVDIDPLIYFKAKSKLSFLQLYHCKSVGDWSVLAHLKTVATLYIHSSKINNLKFVPEMSSLTHFRFVETSVDDGDLSPLLKSRTLRRIAFTNKKNFNYSESDIIRQIDSK